MIELLGFLFLVIFGITAILTIASLPGWIKIPEWYRKKLFLALILEVIGSIIIFFEKNYLADDPVPISHDVTPKNWVALTEDAEIIQPKMNISFQDTSIEYTLGNKNLQGVPNLTGTLTDEGLTIYGNDQQVLGRLKEQFLKQQGFYNSINSNNNEISASNNYTVVKWYKSTNSKWKINGAYLQQCPFHLIVYDDGTNTKYKIINTSTNAMVFRSETIARPLFDVDNRIIHFYKHEGQYYLIRIVEASLKPGSDQFVHVLHIRFKPTLIL